MAKISNLLIHHTEGERPAPSEHVSISRTGGIVGDSHDGGRLNRQVLVSDARVLSQMRLAPGDLREQITAEGVPFDELAPGTRVLFGEAEAEVLGPCAPCLSIGEYLGVPDKEAFRDAMQQKRGMFVLFDAKSAGTKISVGDEIRVLQ